MWADTTLVSYLVTALVKIEVKAVKERITGIAYVTTNDHRKRQDNKEKIYLTAFVLQNNATPKNTLTFFAICSVKTLSLYKQYYFSNKNIDKK